MRGAVASFLVGALLNAAATAASASAGWVSIPPDGADTTVVAFSRSEPGVVWVGTSDGPYRSEDGGVSWLATGLRGVEVLALAVHPHDGRDVWAVSEGPAVSERPVVWRSDDGGATFARHDVGASGWRVYDLALDFEDPEIAYLTAGADLYVTRDGGATWSKLPRIPGQGAFGWYRPVLSTPAAVFAGNGNGLYRSTDHGASWALSGPKPVNEIGAIASDASGQRLWVVAPSTPFPPFTSPAAFTSADGGQSWLARTGGFPAGYLPSAPVAVSPDGGLVLLGPGGYIASADIGRSWSLRSSPGLTCGCGAGSPLAFDPTEAGAVLAVVEGGLARSTDNAATWECAMRGPRDVRVTALLTASDGTLWVATYSQGIFKSTDGGETWTLAFGDEAGLVGRCFGTSGLEAPPFSVVTLTEIEGSIVAGTTFGAFLTRDGGGSWAEFEGVWGTVGAVLQDPRAPTTWLASAQSSGMTPGGLYISHDSGSTWQAKPEFSSAAGLAADPVSGALLADAGIKPANGQPYFGGIVRSTDHGNTWTRVYATPNGAALLADPRVPGRIWAAGGRLHRSDDGGLTWVEVAAPWPCEPPTVLCGPFTLLVDAPRDRLLIVAGDQVFTSLDDGASWDPLTPAVPVHHSLGVSWPTLHVTSVPALALDASGRLLAGTGGRGLFVLEPDVRVPRRLLSR
jgi:photosystem II stability/assembly factor-like uncharacterized protein